MIDHKRQSSELWNIIDTLPTIKTYYIQNITGVKPHTNQTVQIIRRVQQKVDKDR